jgi:hypothetical protein
MVCGLVPHAQVSEASGFDLREGGQGPRETTSRSAKQPVEIIVRPDPGPVNSIAVTLANGALLIVDPDRPDVAVTAKFLEAE